MKSKKIIKLFCAVALFLFVLACQAGYLMQNNKINVQQLDFPFTKDDYYTVALVDGKFVAFLAGNEVTEGVENYRGAYIVLGSNEFQALALPDDPKCDLSTSYTVPGTFPDGRLQIAKLCNRKDDTDRYLMAYDWKTNTLEDIAGILPTGPTYVSWNPDQTIGIASLSDAFSSRTFYLIYPGRYETLDLTISDEGKIWNVKDDFPDFQGAESGKTGNEGYVDWSGDGNSIAFFASPEGIGKSGGQRFSIEYNMYVMGADLKDPKRIFGDVTYPHILHWSPNSKSIAFLGEYGALNRDGLWLYLLKEDRVINIARGHFRDFLWVDDKTLVAIKCDDDFWCGEIFKYTLENIK